MTMIPYPDAIGKWTLHKNAAYQQGTRLRNAGAAVGRKDIWLRGDIMRDCSSRIEYTYCQECGSLHIRRTNLCRDRLCPICAWRLSLQRIGDMMQTLEYLHQQRAHISAAMLTLTIKNVDADNLSNTISHMLHAWDRLLKRRAVQKWVTGYARSIEITRASNGTYHPHIHALLIWTDGYDKDISQRNWAAMWAAALGTDYTPVVDIRAAYSRTVAATEWDKLVSATIECTKYAIKGGTLDGIPDTDLIAVADALKGRRLISYGGIVRTARAALKLPADGAETATDVADTAIECPKCGATDTVILAYTWARDSGAYLLAPYPYSV